ncbi:Haem peroxidase,Haem peroxidase, animal type [Cinara cedri]|uniref:Haem peroxidase,Haem peroxidase, animal type n=1 Tax=Cinara cedri TaxID=506608 RepID=A0A5E4M3R6_9HEMI|nr:Haem peroxidase,Haem peroxidase, animal type [Cinara cedri]
MRLDMFSAVRIKSSTNTIFERILPPAHPIHCPNRNLPQLYMVENNIINRASEEFMKPDKKKRNLLFQAFFKYFVLQYLNDDFNMTITASQLYGSNKATKQDLRSFNNGKMKIQSINGEQFPPYLKSARQVKMLYPPIKLKLQRNWFDRIVLQHSYNTHNTKWAMGHPMLSMDPMLFVMSTLWIREHNRVCDLLKRKWSTWTDDQIFNTAKSIVIGEMMKIMMSDIINVDTGHSFKFDLKPEIFHDQLKNITCSNTPFEFLLTSMWPSSLPEKFNNVSISTMLFSDNRQVLVNGLSKTVQLMIKEKLGMLTYNNYGNSTEPLTSVLLTMSRAQATQSFNNYRRQFGLNAYANFYKLTKNRNVAKKLQNLYKHVEDVELITGMLTEKRVNGVIPTATIMTNSFIVNSILTNSITSKDLWKAETFGGDEGFDIVKNANIETFICNNLGDNCNDFKVSLYAK